MSTCSIWHRYANFCKTKVFCLPEIFRMCGHSLETPESFLRLVLVSCIFLHSVFFYSVLKLCLLFLPSCQSKYHITITNVGKTPGTLSKTKNINILPRIRSLNILPTISWTEGPEEINTALNKLSPNGKIRCNSISESPTADYTGHLAYTDPFPAVERPHETRKKKAKDMPRGQ